MRSIRTLLVCGIIVSLFSTMVGCDSIPLISGDEQVLSASGVVETVDVTVAPEIAGRVVEIYVVKGDPVEQGDLLFRLDDEMLQSQRQLAITSLESAQSNLATALTGLEMAEATLKASQAGLETVMANAEVELLVAQAALDDLYEAHGVARSETSRAVAAANRAVREALYRLDNFTVPMNQRDMTTMQAIEVMRERLDAARQAFEPYKYKDSNDATRKKLKEDLDEAQSDYDAAIRRMEYETDLESAEAALNKNLQDLEALQSGPDSGDVALLEARISAAETAPKQAEAAVEQAEVGLAQAQAQLDQAEKAVAQAQATLDLVDTQMNKLSVVAPVEGVVLVRNINPGEVLNPGASALTIGQLDELTVTVYIPENRYGNINLGDHADLSVDSFPNEIFDAVVVRIADQAEYTPRNVQTQEERSTTVFAIELKVQDPEGKLKPGMPADVVFNR